MGCLSLRNLVVELGNIETLLRVTYLIPVDIWITFPHRKYRFNLAMLEILEVIGRLIMSCSLGHVRLLCDGRYGLELRQSRVNLPQECDNLMGALDLMRRDMCRWQMQDLKSRWKCIEVFTLLHKGGRSEAMPTQIRHVRRTCICTHAKVNTDVRTNGCMITDSESICIWYDFAYMP